MSHIHSPFFRADTITLSSSSGSLRFLRNARATHGYDFRSRQKRPVPLARCVSRYVRRKTRRACARARICAPCDNRTFRNGALPACTFRYFSRRRRRRDDAPPVCREKLVSIPEWIIQWSWKVKPESHLSHWEQIFIIAILNWQLDRVSEVRVKFFST